MDLLSSYGLFLSEIVTVAIIMALIIAIIFNIISRKRYNNDGQLHVTHLNKTYQEIAQDMQLAQMQPQVQKIWLKKRKKEEKAKIKEERKNAKNTINKSNTPTLYVLEFKGSIDADEINSLREEISAILLIAKKYDEVILRLESPGGIVHGYGLAAAQLQRFRDAGLKLTVIVDKIAASGGYMMACVANHIIAAPFSIIGSIGVIAQLPNFNRLLKQNNIDIELHTAGQYKRTLTMFGENTELDREKFRECLNETYTAFKLFVHQMRPSLDLEKVSTGEYWYGVKALELGLIDEIGTSDSIILKLMEKFTVLNVHYAHKRRVISCLVNNTSQFLEQLILKICQHKDKLFL